MIKLEEHTYGNHIFMRMELDGKQEEIDVYLREGYTVHRTTADNNAERRAQIIAAFDMLY